MKFTLRREQEALLDAIRTSLYSNRMVVASSPTGSGKTVMAAEIAHRHIGNGSDKHVWFVVDQIKLSRQAIKAFKQNGVKCNVIQGSNVRIAPSASCSVLTIQTLTSWFKRGYRPPDPTFIIIDECHNWHQGHDVLAFEKYTNVKILGFSATPIRPGMKEIWDSFVKGPTTADLIEDNKLVPTRCFSISKETRKLLEQSLPRLQKTKRDWTIKETSAAMRQPRLLGNAISSYIRHGEGRKAFAYATNISNAHRMREKFLEKNISAEVIDSNMPPREIKRIFDDFDANKFKILVNVRMAVTGVDVPDVSCLIFANPTRSLLAHIQMCGRGLRTADGKTDCIILDTAGNLQRHGRPDTFAVGELLAADEEVICAGNELLKCCPECEALISINCRVCPECDYEYEQEDIEVVDVPLKPIDETVPSSREVWAQLKYLKQNKARHPEKGYLLTSGNPQAYAQFCTLTGESTTKPYNSTAAMPPSNWILNKINEQRVHFMYK